MSNTAKKKVLIIIAIVSTAVLLAVVGFFVYKSLSKEGSKNEAKSSDNTIKFVDAHGQWYEFTPNDKVKKTDYDKDKFQIVNGRMQYKDDKYQSRAGIDVSEHNGTIDWNAVKGNGIEFVFIRIGGRGYGQEGKLYVDKKFDENYNGAKAAGLDVGCYFFSQAINEEEAKQEAEFVLDILKGRKLDLPIVYDPESILNDEARTDNVSGEQFTKNCIAFFDTIDSANKKNGYAYDSMIYANMKWEAFMLDLAKLSEYDIWYADYEPKPQTPYYFNVLQYSESGAVSGVEGVVDLDIQLCK